MPTPVLNPATYATNFQNSCANWNVNCSMIVEYNVESAYHFKRSSRAHAYNDEVVFFSSRDKNNYGVPAPIALEAFGD